MQLKSQVVTHTRTFDHDRSSVGNESEQVNLFLKQGGCELPGFLLSLISIQTTNNKTLSIHGSVILIHGFLALDLFGTLGGFFERLSLSSVEEHVGCRSLETDNRKAVSLAKQEREKNQ